MANRFDPVAVGIPQERRIIRPVIAAHAGRTVIDAAGGDAGIPERIDLGPPFRLEAPVAAGGVFRLRSLADRDVDAIGISRPRALAIAQPILAAADLYDA